MTIQVLNTSCDGTAFTYQIWADITKVDASGKPDPNYIYTTAYSVTPPAGVNPGSYQSWIIEQITPFAEQFATNGGKAG